MKQIQLEANLRTAMKKNEMNRLRQGLKMPAVLYGGGSATQHLELDAKTFEHVLHVAGGTNMLVKLTILGGQAPQQETVMIKAMQRHPMTSAILHVDFYKVSMDKPLETTVPVIMQGTAVGIKEGGVLEQVHRNLHIRCLPALIPENVTVDVTPLHMGDSITVGQIKLAEGVEVLEGGHEPIVHVVTPRKEEEKPVEEAVAAATAAPAEVQQPEVIGEKEREARRAEKEKEKENK